MNLIPCLLGILGRKDNIFFLLFSVEKNHKSLKVWGIFVYSLERYLLSTQQGALRVWECSVSKAAVVSEVRRCGLHPLTSGFCL